MAVRSSTSVGAGFDPKAYTGEVETLTPDAMHELFMSFGPEGPPPGFDIRSVAMDGSKMSPKKRLRGTGFPAEDAPFDDYAMMPMPYESAPEPTFRRDTDTGAMTEMPGLRAGDGRRWSRGKLLEPDTPHDSKYLLDPRYYS
jgi:hypothetical protein